MSLFKHRSKQETLAQETESFPPDESIKTSESRDVRFLLRGLSPEKTKFISDYSKALKSSYFPETPDLKTYKNSIRSTLTFKDAEELRNYTGINYKYINSVLRGFWNYDELGQKTPEKEQEIRESADKISEIIQKSPKLPTNLKTFRGTNLDSFRGYGVESLTDLEKLNGELVYERGFTSSSLSPENSFFERDFEDTYRKKCDIEIEYLIPGGSRDGIVLASDELSYSKNQEEFLFDRGSVFRVMEVETDGETAKLKMALIPKEFSDDENSWN